MALSVAKAAFDMGVCLFDGSTGGIGGCPYAKGATGNVPSELLGYFFARQERFMFNKDAFEKTLNFLNDGLDLNLRSEIFEIQKNGGKLYGL